MNSNKSDIIGNIISTMLFYQNCIQIYHWQTTIYSRHKASDKLYKNILEKIDIFIETLQGSWGTKGDVGTNKTIPILNISDEGIIKLLNEFKKWLINRVPIILNDDQVDLLNIRDEILSCINKTLYKFTLK